jgi:RNA polymerase sigma-70 factor (ECF subfamily)
MRVSNDGRSVDEPGATLSNHRLEFLRFVQKRVRDPAAAEDILQDAVTRSLMSGDSVRDPAAVVAWFYRVLRNAIIDHHRRSRAAAKKLAAFESEPQARAQGADARAGSSCQCVGGLHQRLKPDYRAAIQRIEVDGVPVKDYAAEAGISPSNAAVRVFRARAELKKRLERNCGACAAAGCMDCTCAAAAAEPGSAHCRAGGAP